MQLKLQDFQNLITQMFGWGKKSLTLLFFWELIQFHDMLRALLSSVVYLTYPCDKACKKGSILCFSFLLVNSASGRSLGCV